MDYFIHQSWGRIRIRIPALRNNHFKVNLVKQILYRLEGVKRVSGNLITGSVIINYDPYEILPAKIINVFNSLGLLPNVIGFPRSFHIRPRTQQEPTAQQSQSEWFSEISRFVLKVVLDRALNKSGQGFLSKSR